jgi:H+/Cl- antiporter ClcA
MMDTVQLLPPTAKKTKYRLILQAALIGVLGGLIVTGYKYALGALKDASRFLYAAAVAAPAFIPLVFAALLLLAFVVTLLLKFEPWARGGGIPQVKAQIEHGYATCFLRVIAAKLLGGAVSMFAGLALGREGPSVQLGAASAEAGARAFKCGESEKKFLIICGAGAGLAAAFNAPFAGAILALEELRKDFNPVALLSAFAAGISATLTANLLGGSVYGVFAGSAQSLPLSATGFVVLAGLVLGVSGVAYNVLSLKLVDGLRRLKVPAFFKIAPVFLIAGCVGLFLPLLSYDGHEILTALFSGAATADAGIAFLGMNGIGAIGLIFLFQFAFSVLCFSSGTPGGNFFPVMVTGALIGAFLGAVFSRFWGLSPAYIANFTLLGMVGALTAVVRAPITAVVLCLELTGSFSHMLPFALTAFLAYIVPDLLGCQPLYEAMLSRLPRPNR